MAKYRHMYDDYRRCHKPQRKDLIKVVLFIGKTGTGKTYEVHDEWKHEDFWTMPISNGTMWFDGYDMQLKVLIDDFNGKMSKIALAVFLRVIDNYVIQVPVKGSYCWWMPDVIVVTTNFHPARWYDYSKRKEHYHALCRRFTSVHIFANDIITEVKDLPAFWKKGYEDAQGTFCNHMECRKDEDCLYNFK